MRIPGPGTYIPDVAESGGIGCLGALVLLLLFVIVGEGVSNSIARSGAGEFNTTNYVTHEAMCAPDPAKFVDFQTSLSREYDNGVPNTPSIRRRLISATGSSILQAGSDVRVLNRIQANGMQYSLVSPFSDDSNSPCWIATEVLKMSWGRWFSWKWERYREQRAASREQSLRADRVQARIAAEPTQFLACRANVVTIVNRSREIEQSIPIDVSHCTARGGALLSLDRVGSILAMGE
jgi:hypothetical protein